MRVGVDLGLFNLLSNSEEPMTVDHLAEKAGAALQLSGNLSTHHYPTSFGTLRLAIPGRILRYLASASLIDETDMNTFSSNPSTKMIAQPAWAGSNHHGSALSSLAPSPPNQN